MNRREFIPILGAAAAWPLAARAQQPRRVWRIGVLETTSMALNAANFEAFRQSLRDLGYIEEQNLIIEYRSAEGRAERFTDLAADLLRLNIDVIVTRGTPAVLGLARPGGNVTGLSLQNIDSANKRIELLREVLPGLRRLAVLVNAGNPVHVLEIGEVHEAARTLGIDVATLEIQRTEDIAPAIEAGKARADALYVAGDALLKANRARINILAAGARLPTIYVQREFVDAGGLISFGPNYQDLFGRSAGYVDKILRGAKPADLPVEQPTKFDLAINLITARALGLTVPPSLLARADEVIE
jgi:putative ABC transport system substrate-binding protein